MYYSKDSQASFDDWVKELEESEELTDDELASLDKNIPWMAELDSHDGYQELLGGPPTKNLGIPQLTPSEFTKFALRMPKQDGMGYENFSFEGRRHMIRPYNTAAKRLLLTCARQVEKSTLLGNLILTYSCVVPSHKTLYVSPSSTQTKTFSMDRIKEPIETSPVLKMFTANMLMMNVFEKQFFNRSKITLRYAFLNADRCRGIPAWKLAMDEFQDILSDNIPVIEQCTAHAPPAFKSYLYAGTPKSFDNPIEYYRSGISKTGQPMSSQGEWVVPCNSHGGETGRYWNVLGEKNIGRKGLICEKCGNLINPMHEDAQWAMMVSNGIFENYRIPQLMVPWRQWDEILLDYGRYARDKFYNEVLGLSFDSGTRPLTLNAIKEACNPKFTMNPDFMEALRKKLIGTNYVFAGLDHGTGENSYTVASMGTYIGNKFQIFWVHRFTGEDTDPEIQLKKIISIFRAFKVDVIGSDYGGGFDRNSVLTRAFGQVKLQKYQYQGKVQKKVFRNPKLQRWLVHRTEVMSDVFAAIKRKQILFPRFEEFQDPYAQDMLNIFSEYNDTLRMIQYGHRPDKPDDTFHSVLYCFLASMTRFPRPDIIVPTKEHNNQGSVLSGGYNQPWQG